MSDTYDGHVDIESAVEMSLLNGDAIGTVITFAGLADGLEHFAIRFGTPSGRVLARVHSECVTGDLFGSQRCDCGPQLQEALRGLSREGGCLIYLRQEGRGIGLNQKMHAYKLQDLGLDTFEANLRLGHPADGRSYVAAAQMLAALGVTVMTVLTNNPEKVAALRRSGFDVDQRPTGIYPTDANIAYLAAKRDRAGHRLDFTP